MTEITFFVLFCYFLKNIKPQVSTEVGDGGFRSMESRGLVILEVVGVDLFFQENNEMVKWFQSTSPGGPGATDFDRG